MAEPEAGEIAETLARLGSPVENRNKGGKVLKRANHPFYDAKKQAEIPKKKCSSRKKGRQNESSSGKLTYPKLLCRLQVCQGRQSSSSSCGQHVHIFSIWFVLIRFYLSLYFAYLFSLHYVSKVDHSGFNHLNQLHQLQNCQFDTTEQASILLISTKKTQIF